MRVLPCWPALAVLAVALPLAAGQKGELSADEIMTRVAWNQGRAEDARNAIIYHQRVMIRLHRSHNRLAREGIWEYRVTPRPRKVEKELLSFSGRYERDGKLISYDKPDYRYKGVDIDGDLASSLCQGLTDDKESRDGIASDLFPLTNRRQHGLKFKLAGRKSYQGREVYLIDFEPTEGHWNWKGEVLVDAVEFQPVVVTTQLAKGIPFLVKTMLGTNLKQLGFKVTYQRLADGLWFPASYGGEFELKAVFFYKRTISISLVNSEFRRADVESHVEYAGSAQ
jgi:hypothetical protein